MKDQQYFQELKLNVEITFCLEYKDLWSRLYIAIHSAAKDDVQLETLMFPHVYHHFGTWHSVLPIWRVITLRNQPGGKRCCHTTHCSPEVQRPC